MQTAPAGAAHPSILSNEALSPCLADSPCSILLSLQSQQDELEIQRLKQQIAAAAAAAPPAPGTAAVDPTDPSGTTKGGSAQLLLQRSLSTGTPATAATTGTAACPELPQVC